METIDNRTRVQVRMDNIIQALEKIEEKIDENKITTCASDSSF